MNKVLLITNIPTPYRIPLFNELNKQLAKAGCAFKVAFGAQGYNYRKWDVNLPDCNFDYVLLSSKASTYGENNEQPWFTYSGLESIIQKYSPEIIICPGFSLATVRVWLLSLLRPTKYLIWTGSVLDEGQLNTKWRLWQRRVLISRASGGIVYGSKAKMYLEYLGMPERSISVAINTVDVDFFGLQRHRGESRGWNPASKRHLLYIGYLAERKRLDLLFQIIKYLVNIRQDICLEVVGTGPEEDKLRQLANDMQIESFVRFEGYKQKDELTKYLARADCFLFPTEHDIWGLVLNEAMAAGIPCLSSVHACATHDLIQDGITGFAVDFTEIASVAEKVNWLLDHPEEAAQIGQRAHSYIARHANLQRSACGFVEAVLKAAR